MKKVLFIIGSMRKNSFNRQLAKAAEEMLQGKAEVSYLEYSDLPYMNQDIEFPAPPEVERVRAEVEKADGIWIFTAEYNYQIPGVLKNLLDWLSRPLVPGDRKTASAAGKPVTVSGAGGRNATAGCRKQLGLLFTAMQMPQLKENETGIALPGSAFASGVYEPSEEDMAKLSAQAEAFMAFLG